MKINSKIKIVILNSVIFINEFLPLIRIVAMLNKIIQFINSVAFCNYFIIKH